VAHEWLARLPPFCRIPWAGAVVDQLQSHSATPTLLRVSRSSLGATLTVCCLLWGCDQNTTQGGDGEAGPPRPNNLTTTADGPSCSPVLASDYDQSCTVDSDCVAVGEEPQCPTSGCECPSAAVNKGVATQYQAALSRASTIRVPSSGCSCACLSAALCRGGGCQVSLCSPPLTDTLAACTNLGGKCMYSANTPCNWMGPPDSCAYSDELCCLSAPYDAGPDAGECTAPLDTFGCPATYPAVLSSACLGPFDGLSTASCGSLAAIVHGGPPHWSFCLYQGVDAGALVGAQNLTDIPERCNNTSYTTTGGEVPASCSLQLVQQINPSPAGSIFVACDDAGARDAAGD